MPADPDRIEIHVYGPPPVRVMAPARGPSVWLLLWPLIPIGLMIGIAAMILLAIVALLIVVAGVVIWLFGRVLVGLGWSEAEPLVDAGGGIAAAM
jgi:hypothetical protein